MTTNLTKELAAIQERVSAATEGPWFASTATNLTGFTLDVDEDGMQGLGWTSHGDIPEYGYPDANFIAHARTDVEWMARALQAVVELVSEWQVTSPSGPFPDRFSVDVDSEVIEPLTRAIEGAFPARGES